MRCIGNSNLNDRRLAKTCIHCSNQEVLNTTHPSHLPEPRTVLLRQERNRTSDCQATKGETCLAHATSRVDDERTKLADCLSGPYQPQHRANRPGDKRREHSEKRYITTKPEKTSMPLPLSTSSADTKRARGGPRRPPLLPFLHLLLAHLWLRMSEII